MTEYVPVEIEAKWQKFWEENGSFEPDPNSQKPPYYMLTMLPYPSGDLHIGHWYAMAPSDTYARFLKINPDDALSSTNRRFRSRFEAMEKAAKKEGKALEELTPDQWEQLWQVAKKEQS